MEGRPVQLLLKPLDLPGLPGLLAVPEGGLSLGREDSNAVRLDATEHPHVSAYHARIVSNEGRLEVEDLASKNGTLVNGKEVKRASLAAGDVVQLGRGRGPRFVVVPAPGLDSTISIPREKSEPPRPMSKSTVFRLKTALGLGESSEGVRKLVRSEGRRYLLGSVLLIAVALLVIGLVWSQLDRRQSEDRATLEQLKRELESRLERVKEDLRQKEQLLDAQRERLREQREEITTKLREERDDLVAQIARLRATDAASAESITKLREQLRVADARLGMLEPLTLDKLEKKKQAAVRRTLRAVVYLEKKVYFRSRTTGARMYVTESGAGMEVNFEERGKPFHTEGGGSGFCVSPDGWIVSNAHVVEALEAGSPLDLEALDLEADVELAAVFSGDLRRHGARVERRGSAGDLDLALLKIDAFEGIPSVTLDLGVPLPEPGAPVHLFGFPFGTALPQEGERLTASVLRGMVSRNLDGTIQVQAAIYPGNSGGPVIDSEDRIIGIVTSVQALPSGQIANIGYILPIGKLTAFWPPSSERGF